MKKEKVSCGKELKKPPFKCKCGVTITLWGEAK
jgi:hypothetical protein